MTESVKQAPAASGIPLRRRPSEILRQFLRRDKTPMAILVVAALVGIFA